MKQHQCQASVDLDDPEHKLRCIAAATVVVDQGNMLSRFCEAHAERAFQSEAGGVALFPLPSYLRCTRCWRPSVFGSNHCDAHKKAFQAYVRDTFGS